MPTKPIDRLLFVQGGQCFFCNRSLDRANATVEHLLAASRGGSNGDDNCIACCKSINNLFGSMSLKEKFQVLLNQRGHFECPNELSAPKVTTPIEAVAAKKAPAAKKAAVKSAPKVSPLDAVVAYLKNLKKAKPAKMKTLESTIKAQLKLDEKAGAAVIRQLLESGKVKVNGTGIEYKL